MIDKIKELEKEFETKYGSFELCDVVNQKDHDRLLDFLHTLLISLLQSDIERLEKEYGKFGSFSGSMGFQGLVQGITGFQTAEDVFRDKEINLKRQAIEELKSNPTQ